MYCKYYQAHILRNKVWFFAAALRSSDHLVFERTFDKAESIFEFFVPEKLESYFLDLMGHFEHLGIVSQLKKLPNRFQELQKHDG